MTAYRRSPCDLASSVKMLRMEEVWHPRMGAPLRNRNRLRHGDQTDAVKALYRLIAQWRRETKALLARAAGEIALAQHPEKSQTAQDTERPKLFTGPLVGTLE